MMSFGKAQFQLFARAINLLNSPSRGYLVGGLPRAASMTEKVFYLNNNSAGGNRAV